MTDKQISPLDEYGASQKLGPDFTEHDLEYNPEARPLKEAGAWLNLLHEAEDVFVNWHTRCDNIDKKYANIDRLVNLSRAKEFQMFWANMEVLKPAIYAKPPVPVVVPKFKDRRPVYQAASEVMERCCTVAFDITEIDELMKLIRDDLALNDRGVAWVRYESAGPNHAERVWIDFKNRRDFLHSVARNWREVTWVAAASYLTQAQARERFARYSGDEYKRAEYRVDKEAKNIGGADDRERAKFWEIWDKASRRVVWVAHGCENILDEDEPHLDLRNFFPCPKPAYGTVQRGSLVPVPDVLQYSDQLDEIDLLTGKIHALSEALECKGFYPAGGAELAEAIQSAVQTNTPGRLLIPIANWASFGGTKDVIVWMPIDQIATTITALVAMRKQVIDDIYQIMGLSDIMRGDTDPNETLGAQQLKTQNGSARVRDKQQELARLAKDLVEITSEIITEKFEPDTIIEMSQTTLPTQRMQQQQVMQIQQQLMQMQQQMQMMQQQSAGQPQQPPQPGAQDPMQAQIAQMQQQMQVGMAEIDNIKQQPNIEQVLKFLGDNRAKAFTLDIETDSTIVADEQAEKAARTEFVGMLGQLLPQLSQMVATAPYMVNVAGEILKFSTGAFRAGRSLDGAIDEMVELTKQQGSQPKADDPVTAQGKIALQIEQMKLAYAKTKDDADRQVKVAQVQSQNTLGMQKNQTDAQSTMAEVQGRQQEHSAKIYEMNLDAQNEQQKHNFEMQQAAMKAQMDRQKHELAQQTAALGLAGIPSKPWLR